MKYWISDSINGNFAVYDTTEDDMVGLIVDWYDDPPADVVDAMHDLGRALDTGAGWDDLPAYLALTVEPA